MIISKVSKEKLCHEMELIRENLVEKYEETGDFRDEDVYSLSEEMDRYIIEYMRNIKR